jgi:hypothetical protein
VDTDRAYQVLSRLAASADPAATADEVALLVERSLLRETTRPDQALLATAASGLDGARSSVREARRVLDLAWGPRTGPGARGAGGSLEQAQATLRQATDALESCSIAQATLSSLVSNTPTGSFLSLTLRGRQVTTDLEVWRSRFGRVDLLESIDRVDRLRGSAAERIRIAKAITDSLCDIDQNSNTHWGIPAARASSLLLTFRGGDQELPQTIAQRVTNLYVRIPHPQETVADRLLIATLLASIDPASLPSAGAWSPTGGTQPPRSFLGEARFQWAGGPIRPVFDALHQGLASVAPFSSSPPVQLNMLTASLADLAVGGTAPLVQRAVSVAGALGTVDPIGVACLVRSGWSADDIAVRDGVALDAFQRLGYPPGDAVSSAASVLAASALGTAEFAPRLAALDPTLRSAFPAAPVADALLAGLPVTPAQALLVQKYCVAEVSRAEFYEETTEVDYLALFLTVGLMSNDPLTGLTAAPGTGESPFAGAAGASLRSSIPPPPPGMGAAPLISGAAVGAVLLPALFAEQGFWLYRSYLDYTRQHPVHSNAVPIYG